MSKALISAAALSALSLSALTPALPAAKVIAARSAASTLPAQPVGGLVPFRHLGGRSGTQLLDVRSVITSANRDAVGITARAGKTGRALWHRTFAEFQVGVMPARVGAKGLPGVLVVAEDVRGTATRTDFDDRIWALRGDTGATVWHKRFTGYSTFGSNEKDYHRPTIVEVVHDMPAKADEVLVTVRSGQVNHGGTAHAYFIAGRDGTVTSPIPRVSATSDPPNILPVPDETGDGLGDLLVVHPGNSSTPGFIRLRRGDTAHVMWTTTGSVVNDGTDAFAVGRVSGGAVPDLGVTGLEQSPNLANGGPASLIRGSDGTVLWTRDVDSISPLGGAGSSSTPAVALITQDYTAPPGSAAFQVTAVDAANNTIYDKHITLRAASRGDPSSGTLLAGDVEPDGARDLHLEVFADGARADAVLSMRYAVLRKFHFAGQAQGSLEDGAGTDFVRIAGTTDGLLLTGLDGVTGTKLYQHVIARTIGDHGPVIHGIRVTGHDCSDLALSAVTRTGNVEGVLTARGRWLWRITFKADQATGGMRQIWSKPARYCA